VFLAIELAIKNLVTDFATKNYFILVIELVIKIYFILNIDSITENGFILITFSHLFKK